MTLDGLYDKHVTNLRLGEIMCRGNAVEMVQVLFDVDSDTYIQLVICSDDVDCPWRFTFNDRLDNTTRDIVRRYGPDVVESGSVLALWAQFVHRLRRDIIQLLEGELGAVGA